MKSERRLYKRVKLPNACMICRDDAGGKMNVSTIFDLSENGLGFYTREVPAVGSEIRFDFILPKKNGRPVNGTGKVVWVATLRDIFGDNLTRCGVKFKNLPPDSVQIIHNYIRAAAPAGQ